MIASGCGYIAGCHPHHVNHKITPATGLGVIAVIFLLLIVRGLITGKWG